MVNFTGFETNVLIDIVNSEIDRLAAAMHNLDPLDPHYPEHLDDLGNDADTLSVLKAKLWESV